MSRQIDNLISRLQKVRQTGRDSWIACCPAHADKSPSMTIREVEEGKVLVHCFAGCGIDEIVGAVGISLADLMPERQPDALRKPMSVPFNPRDVLACIQSDATLLCVFISDVTQAKSITPQEAANAYKAAARIVAATRLGGMQ